MSQSRGAANKAQGANMCSVNARSTDELSLARGRGDQRVCSGVLTEGTTKVMLKLAKSGWEVFESVVRKQKK